MYYRELYMSYIRSPQIRVIEIELLRLQLQVYFTKSCESAREMQILLSFMQILD